MVEPDRQGRRCIVISRRPVQHATSAAICGTQRATSGATSRWKSPCPVLLLIARCPLSGCPAPESSPPTGVQAFRATTHGRRTPLYSSAATLDGLSREEPTWTRSWLRSHPSLLALVEGSLSTTRCPPTRRCWRIISNGLTGEQGTAGADPPRSVPQQHLPTASRRSLRRTRRFTSTRTPGQVQSPDRADFFSLGRYLPAGGAVPLIRRDHHARKHFFHHALYRIGRMPGRCGRRRVGDDQGNLIFLSIWARDIAVQPVHTRLTSGATSGTGISVPRHHRPGRQRPGVFGNVDRLENAITHIGERCSVRCPTCGCSTAAASSPT